MAVAASFVYTIDTRECLLDLLFVGERVHSYTAGRGQMSSAHLLEVLAGHRGIVRALAFRSTGELVTAGKDGALFTWALDDWTESFRVIRDLSGQPSLRDERALTYALPNGGHVRVSADDPDIWVERACAIAGRGLSEEEWQEVFADRPHDPACSKGAPSALPE